MQNLLQELIVGNLIAFMIVFMRFGIVLMLMPGIGDGFVSPQIRLLFALAVSFVLTPVLAASLPPPPATSGGLIILLLTECMIGFFIGTIMRMMIFALDVAGNVASAQIGFSAATLFNPATESHGALLGAVYSTLGVTILLVVDLHHQLLAAIIESYRTYPAGGPMPDMGGMADTIGRIVTIAFRIGVLVVVPFLVVCTLLQMGFGVLGRLMPQLQIFFLALPGQIFIGLLMLSLTLTAGVMYWLSGYEAVVLQTLVTN